MIMLLSSGVPLGAEAAVIAPELQRALRSLGPNQEIAVIIHLSDKVNLKLFKEKAKRVRRARLIRALRKQAELRQRWLQPFLQSNRARRFIRLWLINGMALTAGRDVIREIADHPQVERVQLDYAIPLSDEVFHTEAASAEWNIDAIRAPELWALGHDGRGVVVAAMDSGVDPYHPDIGPRYRGGSNSWFDPNGEHSTPSDHSGHGTSAMGLIVGGDSGGSAIGVAPEAQWIAVKIFNDEDEAHLSAIHQGFQWLLDPDGNPETDDAPDIVNNSWVLAQTVNECNTEFSADIAALKAANIAVVFSAGNSGPNPFTSTSPANDPESLAVGAVDQFNFVTGSSGRGPSACGGSTYPILSAPGANVRTADLTLGGVFPDSYTTVSGTSFAAPHVSGAMALLLSALPQLTVSQLESALKKTAVDLGEEGPDNESGYGLIDVYAAYISLPKGMGWIPLLLLGN